MKKVFLLLTVLTTLTVTPLFADSVPKMDKTELKSLMGSKNLVILDVRQGRDWSTSEFKIKDAVRVNDGDLSIVKSYPKENTFVLYCA